MNTVNVNDLLPGALSVQPVHIGVWDDILSEDGYDEAASYSSGWVDVPGRDESIPVIARDGGLVQAILIDGKTYTRDEYADYIEPLTDHDGGGLAENAITEDEWTRAFDSDVDGADEPTSSYYFPLPSVENDPVAAAAKVAPSLCVVQNPHGWGIALTGGNQNMSWEIVEAFVRLGFLPPVYIAQSMPSVGGRGKSDHDKIIVAACLAALDRYARLMEYARDKLAIQADGWAKGF